MLIEKDRLTVLMFVGNMIIMKTLCYSKERLCTAERHVCIWVLLVALRVHHSRRCVRSRSSCWDGSLANWRDKETEQVTVAPASMVTATDSTKSSETRRQYCTHPSISYRSILMLTAGQKTLDHWSLWVVCLGGLGDTVTLKPEHTSIK